jgi:hypothetical protein
MKRFTLYVSARLLAAVCVCFHLGVSAGQTANGGIGLVVAGENAWRMTGDLAGDGGELTVQWFTSYSGEEGTFYTVAVADASGRQLWASPRVRDAEHQMAFGSWDFGSSLPEALADIDGDGKLELLVPAAQSDVSPTQYRIYRWTGRALKPEPPRSLSGSGGSAAVFTWKFDPPSTEYWVQQWKAPGRNGTAVVDIVRDTGRGSVENGTAIIACTGNTFRLQQWIRKPRTNVPDDIPPPDDSPFLFPDSSSRLLTNRELAALTADQLWTARNEIFGRRGLIFSSAGGRALAARLKSAGAYIPVTADQNAVAASFNKFESANVEKIRRYEKRSVVE